MATIAIKTYFTIPILTYRTWTISNSLIIELSLRTIDITKISIENLTYWALTLTSCCIIDLSTCASYTCNPIPSWSKWTLTALCIYIPCSTIGTDNACESIPGLSYWTITLLCFIIPNSSVWTSVNTLTSSPSLIILTNYTGFSIKIRICWTIWYTISIEINWIFFTIWTWWS